MAKGRALFCVFLMVVAAYAIRSATGWSFKAALFPLAVAIPLLVLAAFELVQVLLKKEEVSEGAAVDLDFSSELPAEIVRRRVLGTFVWLAAFIFSVYLIGFPLTVPLFLFSYLLLQSEIGWLPTIAATAITWGGFYFLFQRLVHIQFESGVIQNWLGL